MDVARMAGHPADAAKTHPDQPRDEPGVGRHERFNFILRKRCHVNAILLSVRHGACARAAQSVPASVLGGFEGPARRSACARRNTEANTAPFVVQLSAKNVLLRCAPVTTWHPRLVLVPGHAHGRALGVAFAARAADSCAEQVDKCNNKFGKRFEDLGIRVTGPCR
eukprot:359869-Chlamydomonas_euryale.AAC.26